MFGPGAYFAVGALPHLSVSASAFYAARYVLDTRFGIYISPAATGLLFAASLPSYVAFTICWDYVKEKRQATAMGAVPAPTWAGRWPGSVDLLFFVMDKFINGYPGEGFWDPVNKFGPIFNFRILWVNQIFTCQPEHIKAVLATEFNNFEKGDRFQRTMASVLGTGVFNSDGDMWKFHRSMTRPFFSRDRISHFDIFERHADDAIALMKQRLRSGYAIDFQDVVSRFTLDSATEFLFGNCVHSLKAGLPYPYNTDPRETGATSVNNPADKFARAFGEAQFAISQRARIGMPWPLFEMFKDETKEPVAIVNAYLDPILKDALEKQKSFEASGVRSNKIDEIDDGETLLDHLVKFTKDQTILKDEILNIMIAGRDTTAATLTFVIYLLATNPEVLQRLRAEVLNKVGATNRPTYDDIRDMKYLRAVINETLRLYPPVPFNIRDSIGATTLSPTQPGGKPIYVPPGTSVSYSVFMMHRRKDLWGPDALEFDPDRFLDERLHKYLTPNPFIFLPFNAGPRICLGQQFAYNETSFMLIRLLQNFDNFQLDAAAQPADSRPPASWVNEGGRQAIEKFFPKMHLTMYAHKGLWVKMKEATNDGSAV